MLGELLTMYNSDVMLTLFLFANKKIDEQINVKITNKIMLTIFFLRKRNNSIKSISDELFSIFIYQ